MGASSSRLKGCSAAVALMALLVVMVIAVSFLLNQDRWEGERIHDDAVTPPTSHQEWEN